MMMNSWNNQFLNVSHRFESLKSLNLCWSQYADWPSLGEYSLLLSRFGVKNITGESLSCIESKPRPRRSRSYRRPESRGPMLLQNLTSQPPFHPFHDLEPKELPYEMQILKLGVIPTRLHNWHDFCNMLTWCRFPKIKAVLNALQARPHGVLRNRYQELLTMFDEGGVIRLFRPQKALPGTYPSSPPLKTIYFGHALLEADLCKFKNSAGFTIPIYVNEIFYQSLSDSLQLYPWVDETLAQFITQKKVEKLIQCTEHPELEVASNIL